jgi:hypothetical protein
MPETPHLHQPDSITAASLLAANERFYRTFEMLDYPALELLWENSGRVFCVHPGWAPLRGARAVLDSWKRIIENTSSIRFELSQEEAHISGEASAPIGSVTVFERIVNETGPQAGSERGGAGVIATNLFAFDREASMWLLFHHHASQVALPEEEGGVLLV